MRMNKSMSCSELTRCSKCTLDGNKIFGDIGKKFGLMLFGEAPGKNEVLKKRVFIGAAGKRLSGGLAKIGIDRQDVTIINTVLCRPPENRPPTDLEIRCCRKRVLRTIKKIKPRVIVCLGNRAFSSLFGRNPTPRDRFKPLWWKKRRVCLVYHPAYFLYNHDQGLEDKNYSFIKLMYGVEKWRP